MITRQNLKEVINALSNDDKALIMSDQEHEYTELELCVFNTGIVVYATLTNSLDRMESLNETGDVILETEEIQNILKEGKNE